MAGKKSAPSESQREFLRALPAVDELIEAPELISIIEQYGRSFVVESARSVIEGLRRDILAGKAVDPDELGPGPLAGAVAEAAARIFEPSLRPLINATGVVVHTNLGRSVLAQEAIDAVVEAAASYSNLEYNLEEGKRGSRHDHIRRIIVALTGAEDALVVNNNAAAVLLALSVFARGLDVIVSRGELIEIGGSFRIPDIMKSSLAHLVEVGTTNKTKLADYESAIGPDTAMLLHVHTSNYMVVGFTAEVGIREMVKLGHERGLIVVDDLGSGVLAELPAVKDEPSVHDSLAAGADIVTFSGDKLLGGPQAGIIVGGSKFIEKMKKHPMARAMRVDKMTLAALQATLSLYLKPEEALKRIPTLRMLGEPDESLKARAEELAMGLRKAVEQDAAGVESKGATGLEGKGAAGAERATGAAAAIGLEQATSKVGGGALPLLELDSWVCSVIPTAMTVDDLATRLRETDPPVIGRIHKERLLLDARTILPGQVDAVVGAVSQALKI